MIHAFPRLAALSVLVLSGPAFAGPGASQGSMEAELRAILARNHAEFVRSHAGEIKDLTTIPEDIVPKVHGAPVRSSVASPDGVRQRILLMKMQVNALKSIQLTQEGLNRLGAADAPSDDKVAVADVAVGWVYERVIRLGDDARRFRGEGMYESVRLTRRALARLQVVSEYYKADRVWGADDMLRLRAELSEQLEALAAEVPDDTLIPVLRTDGLKKEWETFAKAQREGLEGADKALDANKISGAEYASLIGGRRDLARMWELYQDGWLKR